MSLARFAAARLLYSSFFGLGTLIVVTSYRTDTFGLPTLTSRILSADSALQKNNHLENATAKEEVKLLFQPFNISFFAPRGGPLFHEGIYRELSCGTKGRE